MGLTNMPRRLACALALVALAAGPALAQSEEDVVSSIETIHGDSNGFFEIFASLQDAVMFENPTDIAQYAFYPLTIRANGETYDVIDEADLVDNFSALIDESTLDTIASQDVADLIVTSEGVGFGDGAVWISNVCLDDSCAETAWGIISINN